MLASVERIRHEGFAEGPSADGAAWSLATPLAGAGPSPIVLGVAGPAERMRATAWNCRG